MLFDYVLGIRNLDNKNIGTHRHAIRAVIFKDGKILMVRTNKGDYKFPGGGAEKGESHEETLFREVVEETGYVLKEVKNKIGQIVELRYDDSSENTIFQMTSHYYICEITGEKILKNLDQYEADLGFEELWITVDEALMGNEEILINHNSFKNPWVYRESNALKALLDSEI